MTLVPLKGCLHDGFFLHAGHTLVSTSYAETERGHCFVYQQNMAGLKLTSKVKLHMPNTQNIIPSAVTNQRLHCGRHLLTYGMHVQSLCDGWCCHSSYIHARTHSSHFACLHIRHIRHHPSPLAPSTPHPASRPTGYITPLCIVEVLTTITYLAQSPLLVSDYKPTLNIPVTPTVPVPSQS